jgi:hypothetical protein
MPDQKHADESPDRKGQLMNDQTTKSRLEQIIGHKYARMQTKQRTVGFQKKMIKWTGEWRTNGNTHLLRYA